MDAAAIRTNVETTRQFFIHDRTFQQSSMTSSFVVRARFRFIVLISLVAIFAGSMPRFKEETRP
jgi:hypothetical protein